jgi:hypothetical protein
MERLEASEGGRVLIGAFVLVVLVCIVTTTLPVLGLQRAFTRPAEPILQATALEQDWAMFAPEPRREQLRVAIVLHYQDGSSYTWHAPSGDPVFGAARDYRWRKWLENTFLAQNAEDQRLTARWVAREAPRPGALSATIIRSTAPVAAPGPAPPTRWSTTRHTVELGSRN